MTVNMRVSNEWNRTCWPGLGWVMAGVLLATAVRFPFQPIIRDVSPFLFYLPVVIAVAIAFGQRFGLLATLLSVLPANYFWMPPDNAFELNLNDAFHVLGFSIAGLSVSWLSEAGRKRKQLEEHLRATLAGVGDAIITTDCCGRIIYLNAMAEVLTELDGAEASGCMIGSALSFLGEDGRRPLNGIFQIAINNDDLENIPRRLIVCSKTGRQYRVEQKTSRILDPAGRKLGIAILFHQAEPEPGNFLQPSGGKLDDLLNAGSRSPRVAMIYTQERLMPRCSYDAADFGGIAVYVLELSKKLAQLGYEVDIWTLPFQNDSEIESVGRQVRILRVPSGQANIASQPGPADCVREWSENVLQFIRKHRLGYEWVNSHGLSAGHAGQFLTGNLGVPHIHAPHLMSPGTKSPAQPAGSNNRAKFNAQPNRPAAVPDEESVMVSAAAVIATSPQQQEVLLRDCGLSPEKCRLIPYGYDETRFYPAGHSARKAIRKRLGFRTPVVQGIGRLAHKQGCELMVRAFAIVSQRMPEATLHLTLGGQALTPPETSTFIRLRALAGELGLARKIFFESSVPDEQRADYYRAADVLVLSAAEDSAATIALEAIACGTPTVLANDTGRHQWLETSPNGFELGLGAPEKLARKILKILEDPKLRQKLSLRGARMARSRFTWTGIAQELLVLAGSRNGGPETPEEWICAD